MSTIQVKPFTCRRPDLIDICPHPKVIKPSYGPALLLQPKPRPYVTPGECVLRIKNFNLSSFLTPNNPNLCIYVLFFFLLIPNVRQFYYYTLAAKTRLYSSVQYTSLYKRRMKTTHIKSSKSIRRFSYPPHSHSAPPLSPLFPPSKLYL